MSSCTFESETLIKKQLEANIAFNNFVLAKLTMNDLTCKKAFYNVTLSRLPFCAKKKFDQPPTSFHKLQSSKNLD